MDVVANWPGQCSQVLVDVTARCPYGVRYEKGRAAGAAARAGEQEKEKRYGGAAMPLAFETLGRLGVESQRALERLAQLAREHAAEQVGQGRRLVASWRLELERQLVWAEADILLVAVGDQTSMPTFARGMQNRAEQNCPS